MLLLLTAVPPLGNTALATSQDYLYFSSDTILSAIETVDKTVVISPNVTLTIQSGSDYVINGNLIIYGELKNTGKLTVNGEIYANNYNNFMFGDSSNPAGKLSNSGSLRVQSLKVTTDYPDPLFDFTGPEDQSTIGSSSIEVTGVSFPGLPYDVSGPLNGGGALVKEDGTFAERIVLQEGSNEIKGTVTDPFGNTVTKNMTINYEELRDAAAPVVEGTTPSAGTSNVPLDIDISITYNEPIKEGTHYFDIFIDDEEGQSMSSTRIEDNTLFIKPENGLKYGTTYTVRVSPNGVMDMSGNSPGELFLFSFTTERDMTPPEAPGVDEVTDQETALTGTAEVDSTIKVKTAGSVIGTGKVGSEGTYRVTIPKQKAGTLLEVTATDQAGNSSQVAQVTVKDATAPMAPVVDAVTDQSTSVTGKAEVDSMIKVKTEGTEIGKAKVGSDGSYHVTIPKQKAGTILEVSSTNQAGNESVVTKVTVKDLTGPPAPMVDEVTNQATSVTGKSEANSVISVRTGGSEVGTGKTNSEGTFAVTISKQQAGKVLEVTAMDQAGNKSDVTKVTVKDRTAPPAPSVDAVTDGSTTVTGKAEMAATIKVRVDGNEIGTATTDSAGTYRVAIPKQKAGKVLEVIAIDEAGNKSEAAYVTVKDGTPPSAPQVKNITDQTTIVTGSAEEGSTVTLKAGNITIGTGTASDTGTFEIPISLQQVGAVITVTSTDESGLVSTATKVTVVDGSDVPDPEVAPLTDLSSKVSGDCYCYKVVVKKGDAVLGEGTPREDGRFSIPIDRQQAGTEVTVYAIDTATGNTSYKKVTVKLSAPTVNEVTDQSIQVTGKAKAGVMIKVKVNGTEVGKSETKADGTFTVAISKLAAGSTVEVTATDKLGNVSETVKTFVKDVTAPVIPTVDTITNQSLNVRGKTEPGVLVKVMVGSGTSPIGEGTSKQDGSFDVEIPAYPTPGERFYVTATDPAGNTSKSSYVTAVESVKRLSGINRYSTAVEISKQGWKTADTVIIARGDSFPDALAGTPLAYKLDAPILLTTKNSLSLETKAQLKNLTPKKVIILGGKNAIAPKVENQIKEVVSNVRRISGNDRFETAQLIASELGGNPAKAILAYGHNFPDALAVASYAARNGYPIVLTNKDSLPSSSKAVLNGKTEVIAVGGEGVISRKVTSNIKGVKRISGANRFETSVNLVKQLGLKTDKVFVANGYGFADALTGSVLAAKKDAPLLLVNQNSIPKETYKFVQEGRIEHYMVLGGKGAVSGSVVDMLGKIRR
ncbi:Ig-like domain-containing protein [Rossellomorea sp. GCM10028870]|uniref:Ig-like domain-containing protein n=1 Tax=Rossellomorea sp. GCM10028870 TaxID=3273426 RepID=UPI00366A99C6